MNKIQTKKSKMGRISKNETYIIQGLLSDGKSVQFISRELNRPEKVIQKYVENKRGKEDITTVNENTESSLKGLDLMTSDKDKKGQRPIISTAASSSRGDSYTKQENNQSKRHQNCIFTSDGESINKDE